MQAADTVRLILFAFIWTSVWVAPLPRLGRRAELVAGLIPFVAFGSRVFAGFFVGVPEDDPVRTLARPLLDWVNGLAGFPPYAWVLDGTVALGMAWFAVAFDVPRRARIATAWVIPVVAALAVTSLAMTGLPIERLLAKHLPAVVLAWAVGSSIGAMIRWTPSSIPDSVRTRSAIVAMISVPTFVALGTGVLSLGSKLPPEHGSQAESIVALVSGVCAALIGSTRCGFERPRSRFLFAMAVGVAAGAVVALYA